ncbi:hypothetical protein [Piscinibacter sp.]|uniref:hypothetical protein n=1 Tax=Piscinibacter sp. TaxID=1903157 RepID=UPI002BBA228A|nr:hypothetical protein [Albitalea sp.]HUG23570.1 hypothetical protein [Albitalea sp.]
MRARRSLWTVVLAAALAGCGGGGSSSGDGGFKPPGDDVDARAAWENLLTTTRTWVVSGVASDGFSYTASISVAPGSALAFPVTGNTAARSIASIVLTRGAATVDSRIAETFFDAATGFVVGLRHSIDGVGTFCSPAASAAVPPDAAANGSSGALFTIDELDGCLVSSAKIGSATQTWSVEFESETGITFFCTNATERTLSGSVIATESDCIEVSADGSLGNKARVTVSSAGFTLVARN